ncbi:MAG: 3-phosphoshikimate 1-carboxyvinyltransferase [Clostridia bacterium]
MIKVTNAKLNGKISAITSKSYLHRILIASSLAQIDTLVLGFNNSNDIFATIGCLQKLGTDIIKNDAGYLVKPIKNIAIYNENALLAKKGESAIITNIEAQNTISKDIITNSEATKNEAKNINSEAQNAVDNVILQCNESGSTLRFLLPIVSALGISAQFDTKGNLSSRPIDGLLNCLKSRGLKCEKNPIKISGKIASGNFKIDASISSQYITGLLFALPLLDGDSTIEFTGDLQSKNYLDITLDTLKQFNIKAQKNDNGFCVFGNQKYVSPKILKAEGDWSNGAFWLVAGALCGDVTVKGLNLNSCQGDKQIVQILKDMQANITSFNNEVCCKKSNLQCINLDVAGIPDLAPIVAVACANANGVSTLKNVERLKFKECDRLLAIVEMLTKLGIKCEVEGNNLRIWGGKMQATTLNGFNDHRIVMSACIAGLVANGETFITTENAVDKSYPTFYDDFIHLGGSADVQR